MAVNMGSMVDRLKPVAGMVLVQVVFAGVNILYKLAANDGMDLRVLVAYRHLFGAAFLLPLAFFVERFTLSLSISIRWEFQEFDLVHLRRRLLFFLLFLLLLLIIATCLSGRAPTKADPRSHPLILAAGKPARRSLGRS